MKKFCQTCFQKFKGRRGQLVCDKCLKNKYKPMENEEKIKEEEAPVEEETKEVEPDLDETGTDESLV